jgi:hypothetical protein
MKSLFLVMAVALVAGPFSATYASDAPKADACGECCGQADCGGVVPAYVKVSMALAADDLVAAQAAGASLGCCLKCADQPKLAKQVAAFVDTGSIKEARELFKPISAAVIPIAEKAGNCYIMTCPMAGADWVQTDATLANPYYGSQMLRCGSIKKTVKLGS